MATPKRPSARNGGPKRGPKRDIHNPNETETGPKRRRNGTSITRMARNGAARNGIPIKFSPIKMGHPSKQDTVKFPPCLDFYGCP